MKILLSHEVAKKRLGLFKFLLQYPLVIATKFFGFPPYFKAQKVKNEKFVFDALVLDNPKRFLEIGSGYGRMALSICKETRAAGICVDPDTRDIKTLEQLSRELNLSCIGISEDIHNCKFEKGQFDLIYGIEVMEHIKDDRKLLQLIHLWLKSGGRFVFQTPFHFKQMPDRTEHIFGHVRNGYSQQSFEKINQGLLDFKYYCLGKKKECNWCSYDKNTLHPLKLVGVGIKF